MLDSHVWWHLVEVLVAVLLDVGIRVDGQLLVGIHRDEHLANVGLQGEETSIRIEQTRTRTTKAYTVPAARLKNDG